MSRIINLRRGASKILFNTALWHLSYYALGRGFPLAATFQLTNRCNLRCVMCNIPNNPVQGVLGIERFKKIIDGLKKLGCCYASLSGGEVLTIPNFLEYLSYAKTNLPSVNFVTNGLLLDGAAAREVGAIQADSVSLSLDGLKETHERIRNREGAFSKTLEAIENLKRHAPKVKVVVNTVITPWNLDELRELTEFVATLGVEQKFQPLNEHPRFEGQKNDYDIESKKEFDAKKVEALIEYLVGKKHVANSPYFLKSIPSYLARKERRGLFAERCLLPYFFCEFREDGRMYPCLGGVGWKDGHSVEQGVDTAFYGKAYRQKLKALESCRACTKSYSVCYIEPRVTFPAPSFIKYKLFSQTGK